MSFRHLIYILCIVAIIAGFIISCGTGASPSREKEGLSYNINNEGATEPTCDDIMNIFLDYTACETECYSGQGDPSDCDYSCQDDLWDAYVPAHFGEGGCIDKLLATGAAVEEFFDCFASFCQDCFTTCNDQFFLCDEEGGLCFSQFWECIETECSENDEDE